MKGWAVGEGVWGGPQHFECTTALAVKVRNPLRKKRWGEKKPGGGVGGGRKGNGGEKTTNLGKPKRKRGG